MLEDTTEASATRSEWWRERRKKYNRGLIIAGVLAYICYVLIVSIFHRDDRLAEVEITVFTMIFQGMGYLVMMLIANLFYNLGPLAELICKPRNPLEFRSTLFNLGFWFSVALPFLIPFLLIISLVLVPVID